MSDSDDCLFEQSEKFEDVLVVVDSIKLFYFEERQRLEQENHGIRKEMEELEIVFQRSLNAVVMERDNALTRLGKVEKQLNYLREGLAEALYSGESSNLTQNGTKKHPRYYQDLVELILNAVTSFHRLSAAASKSGDVEHKSRIWALNKLQKIFAVVVTAVQTTAINSVQENKVSEDESRNPPLNSSPRLANHNQTKINNQENSTKQDSEMTQKLQKELELSNIKIQRLQEQLKQFVVQPNLISHRASFGDVQENYNKEATTINTKLTHLRHSSDNGPRNTQNAQPNPFRLLQNLLTKQAEDISRLRSQIQIRDEIEKGSGIRDEVIGAQVKLIEEIQYYKKNSIMWEIRYKSISKELEMLKKLIYCANSNDTTENRSTDDSNSQSCQTELLSSNNQNESNHIQQNILTVEQQGKLMKNLAYCLHIQTQQQEQIAQLLTTYEKMQRINDLVVSRLYKTIITTRNESFNLTTILYQTQNRLAEVENELRQYLELSKGGEDIIGPWKEMNSGECHNWAPPSHSLNSTEIQTILELWTGNIKKREKLTNWISYILNDNDISQPVDGFSPRIQIMKLFPEVRDKMMKDIFPVILRRRDVHVTLSIRPRFTPLYDVRVMVNPITENIQSPNPANLSPIASQRLQRQHLLALQAMKQGYVEEDWTDSANAVAQSVKSQMFKVVASVGSSAVAMTARMTKSTNGENLLQSSTEKDDNKQTTIQKTMNYEPVSIRLSLSENSVDHENFPFITKVIQFPFDFDDSNHH